MVSEESGGWIGDDLALGDRTGVGTKRGIDEDHSLRSTDGLHHLGRELVERADFDFGIGERALEALSDERTHGVITAEGITVTENEDSGHQGVSGGKSAERIEAICRRKSGMSSVAVIHRIDQSRSK